MLSKQHHSVLFLWPGARVPVRSFREGGQTQLSQLVNNKAQESCVPALLLMLWMVSCFSLHRIKHRILNKSPPNHQEDFLKTQLPLRTFQRGDLSVRAELRLCLVTQEF